MEINVFMQKLQIKHKTCYIDQNGSDGPIILWGMYPHRGNEIAHMWECLMETVNDQDFLLCAFQVEDWNGDFSHGKHLLPLGMKILRKWSKDFTVVDERPDSRIKNSLWSRQRNLSDRIFPCRIVCFMDSI